MNIKNILKGVVSALPIIAVIGLVVFVGMEHTVAKPSQNSNIVFSDIEQPRQRTTKSYRISKQDIHCLATNIYHEARNQSERGMIGVAFVTVNRTKANGFPSSVCDVVYERTKNLCQFSWVCEKKNKNINDIDSYNQAIAVAKKVLFMYNRLADPTQGALYYHATYINPRWKNLVKTTRIEDHIFYK